jgi:ClpA/ClpB-like protein
MSVYQGASSDLISSAEDEARMLGQSVVEPEHLLLAFARQGGFARLLHDQGAGVSASEVHGAIVRGGGMGDELVIGRVPRSPATRKLLERAFDLAAERGSFAPQGEHVLLALGENERVMAVLRELGVTDVEALVDVERPDRRAALSQEKVKHHLFEVGMREAHPDGLFTPPVFERFTVEARRAVRAASESASLLENYRVEPFHLLLGCLHVPDSLAARVLETELAPSDMGTLGEAMERAAMYGPRPAHQATGIFTDAARCIVAERALAYAYRHDHSLIGTGHLLLATLDAPDRVIDRIVGSGVMGSGPVHDRLARTLIRALPGDERLTDRVLDGGVIHFDVLIAILTSEFIRIAPAGWELRGSARSGGVRLKVPNSRSEEDFAVHLEWIAAEAGPARDRLLRGTRRALEDLQAAVIEHTGQPWPANPCSGQAGRPEAHAEFVGDDDNPVLRLWYGDRGDPTLEVTSTPIFMTSVIHYSR